MREKAVERWEKLKKKEGETKERERRKGEEAKALEKALRVSLKVLFGVLGSGKERRGGGGKS